VAARHAETDKRFLQKAPKNISAPYKSGAPIFSGVFGRIFVKSAGLFCKKRSAF
jgi:hypothetical protein